MPINAGAVGIRPITPERPLREQEGIQRRDEGTVAGFRPVVFLNSSSRFSPSFRTTFF